MMQTTWGRNAVVTALVDSDATAQNIFRSMDQIALDVRDDDQVWLYNVREFIYRLLNTKMVI